MAHFWPMCLSPLGGGSLANIRPFPPTQASRISQDDKRAQWRGGQDLQGERGGYRPLQRHEPGRVRVRHVEGGEHQEDPEDGHDGMPARRYQPTPIPRPASPMGFEPQPGENRSEEKRVAGGGAAQPANAVSVTQVLARAEDGIRPRELEVVEIVVPGEALGGGL